MKSQRAGALAASLPLAGSVSGGVSQPTAAWLPVAGPGSGRASQSYFAARAGVSQPAAAGGEVDVVEVVGVQEAADQAEPGAVERAAVEACVSVAQKQPCSRGLE